MGLLKCALIVALATSVVFGTAAARGGAKPPRDTRVVFVGPGASIQVQGIEHVSRLPTRPAWSGDRASHVLQPNERPSLVSRLRSEHVALLLRELAQQEADVPSWTQSLSRDDEAIADKPAVSKGGSNTARNLELRCETCNRKKGATI